MHTLATAAVAIADEGLKVRAMPGAGGLVPSETHFLNALKESLETGEVPADELIRHFETDWGGDVTRVFEDFSY